MSFLTPSSYCRRISTALDDIYFSFLFLYVLALSLEIIFHFGKKSKIISLYIKILQDVDEIEEKMFRA